MKLFVHLSLLLFAFSVSAQKNATLIVGTYTSGKSEGIYVYQFNTSNAKSKLLSSTKISNPSFIAVSPNKKYVYAVTEDADSANNGGGVVAYSFNKKQGTLTLVNKQHSGGNHPCYVACDQSGRWLFAGNYTSGNFSLFPLDDDGSIGPIQNNVQHFGKGLNPDRQEKPHVHGTFVSNDNKKIVCS